MVCCPWVAIRNPGNMDDRVSVMPGVVIVTKVGNEYVGMGKPLMNCGVVVK